MSRSLFLPGEQVDSRCPAVFLLPHTQFWLALSSPIPSLNPYKCPELPTGTEGTPETPQAVCREDSVNEDFWSPSRNPAPPTRLGNSKWAQQNEDREIGSHYRPDTEIKVDGQTVEFLNLTLQLITHPHFNLVSVLSKGYSVLNPTYRWVGPNLFKCGDLLFKAKTFVHSNRFSISTDWKIVLWIY